MLHDGYSLQASENLGATVDFALESAAALDFPSGLLSHPINTAVAASSEIHRRDPIRFILVSFRLSVLIVENFFRDWAPDRGRSTAIHVLHACSIKPQGS